MNWAAAEPVFVIGLFVLWIYGIYRMFAAKKNGQKKPGYVVVDPQSATSSDDLVIVAHFTDQLTADLHRVHLESEGIESVVLGNSFSRRQGRYVMQVRAEDAPRAMEILNRELSELSEMSE